MATVVRWRHARDLSQNSIAANLAWAAATKSGHSGQFGKISGRNALVSTIETGMIPPYVLTLPMLMSD
jgi:hypothetical protein